MKSAAFTTSRRALIAGFVGLLSAIALTGAPNAVAAGGCPGALTTPFLPWADIDQYWLASGGTFEAKSTWSLAGGAAIASGNETFYVGSKTDSHSLSIPAGGSATTPSTCITFLSPVMRFFATGGNATSPLKVEAIVSTASGTTQTEIASVGASTTWKPTPQILVLANLAALASPDGTTSVKFRFSNPGTAAWKIDDVYVDPWRLK